MGGNTSCNRFSDAKTFVRLQRRKKKAPYDSFEGFDFLRISQVPARLLYLLGTLFVLTFIFLLRCSILSQLGHVPMDIVLILRDYILSEPDNLDFGFGVNTFLFVPQDLLHSMALVELVQKRIDFYPLLVCGVIISFCHPFYFQLNISLLGVFVFVSS